jgi:hypothetical protein
MLSCGNKKTGENQDAEEKPFAPSLIDSENVATDTVAKPIPTYMINLENVANKTTEANLSQIGRTITYIPLETHELGLLDAYVGDIIFFNHSILINAYQKLHQFDESGKFIKKIGMVGQGPGDYIYMHGVFPNLTGDKFYMLDDGKIDVYNSKAEYIQSISTKDSQPRSFGGIMLPNGHFFLYLGSDYRVKGTNTTIYSFAEMDTLGQVIRKIANPSPIVAPDVGGTAIDMHFYRYNNRVHFMDYMSDTLFSISADNEIAPYVVARLGWMKGEAVSGAMTPRQRESLSKLSIKAINEDDKLLYINMDWGYYYYTKRSQYALFEKATRKLIPIGDKGFRNDIDGAIPFFPDQIEADGSKVMSLQAADFKEKILSLDYDTQFARYGRKFKKAWDLASQLEEDDNPILIIVK